MAAALARKIEPDELAFAAPPPRDRPARRIRDDA